MKCDAAEDESGQWPCPWSVQTIADILAGACLICGAVLSLAAGVGPLRFPDLLSRMHAVTMPQVLDLLLILIGTALRLPNVIDITTLILVGIFQLVTHRSGRIWSAGLCTAPGRCGVTSW